MAAGVSVASRCISRVSRRQRTSQGLWRGRSEGDFRLTVLDTNVIVHYLKGDPAIASRIAKTGPNELAIPTIVVYEIEYGTLKSKLPTRRRSELERGLKNIKHLPFDSDAALAAAQIRVELEKRGAVIGPMDILIAGTALSLGALLVTNNADEFRRVPGLRVTDWRS